MLFFPHIVIIIWLYIVANGPVIKTLHPGLGVLLSLAIYVFIVFNGWYPLIANLSIFWLTLTIIFSLFYFLIPKFAHPSSTEARVGIGRRIVEKVISRRDIDKAITQLNEDLRYSRRKLDEARHTGNNSEVAYYSTQVDEYEKEIRRLQRQRGAF